MCYNLTVPYCKHTRTTDNVYPRVYWSSKDRMILRARYLHARANSRIAQQYYIQVSILPIVTLQLTLVRSHSLQATYD